MSSSFAFGIVTLAAAAAAAVLCHAPVEAAPPAGAAAPATPCQRVLQDTRHPRFAECLAEAYRTELKR